MPAPDAVYAAGIGHHQDVDVLLKCPNLAAGVAGERYAFAFGLSLRAVAGALIKDAVQPVGPKRLVDDDAVFFLEWIFFSRNSQTIR